MAYSSTNKEAPPPAKPQDSKLSWETSTRLDTQAVVTVPYSGLYSISFGHANKIHCQRRKVNTKRKRFGQDDEHKPKQSEAPPAAADTLSMTHHLVIKQGHVPAKGNDCGDDTVNVKKLDNSPKFPLPWQETDGNQQLLDPSSVFLGKIVWIDQHCQLTICPIQQQENQPTPPAMSTASLGDSETANKGTGNDNGNPLYWYVRLFAVPRARPETTEPRKPWACAICGRAFPTAFGVSQHQDVAHHEEIHKMSESSSSIWTTPLSVVYDDDYLAVVNKPQGMAVMGDGEGKTLQRSSLLLALLSPGSTQRRPEWPAPKTDNGTETRQTDKDDEDEKLDSFLGKPRLVHRLDAATGGLLVVAKTRRTEAALKFSFEERTCHKTYRALAYGNIPNDEGECSQELSGKASLTGYRVLGRSRSITSPDGWLSSVELYPHTGRQHQLRRHMLLLGHPLWGDRRYYSGPKRFANGSEYQSRLCLWAVAIRFPHPVTGKEVSCQIPDPEWLQKVVQHEEDEWRKANRCETN